MTIFGREIKLDVTNYRPKICGKYFFILIIGWVAIKALISLSVVDKSNFDTWISKERIIFLQDLQGKFEDRNLWVFQDPHLYLERKER